VGLNTLRSRRRRRAVFSEEEAPETSGRGPDPLLVRRLRAALLELSEEKAEALVMADVLGHDIAEIATLTGATVSATQSRVGRARAELRSLLEAP
jgi:DNA-directed RNA polymerase specialized sigma24 family protein